ncbi:MAG: hypothetical protein AB1725_05040 [Armatimonadota bacterium]
MILLPRTVEADPTSVGGAAGKPFVGELAQAAAEGVLGSNASCSGDVGKALVFISGTELGASRLRDEVAGVVRGQWVVRSGRLYLERPSTLDEELHAVHLGRWKAFLRDKMKESEALLSALPPPAGRAKAAVEGFLERARGSQAHIQQDAYLQSAATYLALHCAIAVGPERLASLQLGEVQVFSSRPTPTQRPLPDIREAVREYVETEEALARLLKDQAPPEGYDRRWWDAVLSSIGTPGDVGRVHLYVRRDLERIWLSVVVYSSRDMIRLRGGVVWGFRSPASVPERVTAAAERAGTIQLDRFALERARLLSPFAEGTVSAELRDRLLEPGEFDPLSYAVVPAIAEIARELGVPVVAVLDDRLDDIALQSLQGGTLRLGAFLQAAAGIGMRFELGEDVLRVYPEDAYETQAVRVDRKTLRRFLSSAVSERRVTIWHMADYIASSASGPGLSLQNACLLAYGLGAERPPKALWLLPSDTARFLAALTPLERKALSEGRALSAGALSATARKWLHLWCGAHATAGAWVDDAGTYGRSDLLLAATECMPSGCHAQVSLTLSRKDVQVVRSVTASAGLGTNAFTAEELGLLAAERVRTGEAQSLEEVLRGQFASGVMATGTLRVVAPPGVEYEFTFIDSFTFPERAAPRSFASLDAEFRSSVLDAFRRGGSQDSIPPTSGGSR